MMRKREIGARLRPWAVGALGLALFGWALASRGTPDDGVDAPAGEGSMPSTGALLLDLEDDAEEDDWERLGARAREAIAPEPWTGEDRAALGELLSDPAELYRLRPPPGEVDDLLRLLSDDPAVEAIEIERRVRLPEPVGSPQPSRPEREPPRLPPGGFVPNDPYYPHQWHLQMIGMQGAWRVGRGVGAVVAVIDTGISYRDHGRFRRAPDLADTRFVPGWDFVDGDGFPDDEHGHGTHVAGTVAQSTHNALGVAGVAPSAALMPIRVLDRRGAGTWGGVAAGIRWAADHGARVINLSLGGPLPSRAIANAIAHARSEGATVVAAAGNTGRGRVQYPAAHDGAIAVGAVRFDRRRAFYSSHGRGLALMAPGGDLRVDQNEDGLPDGVLQNTMVNGDPSRHDYVAFQGTSMASPHVAGAAALLFSAGLRHSASIERVLRWSAVEAGPRAGYGAGVLDVDRALDAVTLWLPVLRGAVAFFLGLSILWWIRRKRSIGRGPRGVLAGAVLFAGGLAALSALFGADPVVHRVLGAYASLSAVMPGWSTPIAFSALLPVAALALVFGNRRLRPIIAALSVGVTAVLLTEALLPTRVFGWGPDLLAVPWLFINAAVAHWIAWAAMDPS